MGGGNVWGEIAWLPETINGGSAYYIQHKNTGKWLNANNNTLQSSPNATWTPSTKNSGFTFGSSQVNGQDYRWKIYNSFGDKCTTTETGGATENICAEQADGSYDVYVTRSSLGTTYYLHAAINGSNTLNVEADSKTYNAKGYWYFYGTIQYANHNALVAYEAANNALASYNASNLPNALWNQIKDAVNGATDYLSYTEWLKTTDKSANIASATSTLTTFSTTYGSTISATSSAYTSALANEFAEVASALSSAEEGESKTTLQNAYNTALTDIEAAESADAISTVVSTLNDALTEYYLENKPQPAFNKNYEDAAANLLVEGTIENAFIIQNAPSYTISYKDNGASDASATSAVITFDGGTITAIGAGSVVLVLDQTETAEVKAGHAEFAFTVSKHANTLAPNQTLEFYTTYDNLASLFTTNSDGALTFRLTPDGEEITSITTKDETELTLYVFQDETEKVYGANESFTLNVQAAAKYADQTLAITNTEGNNTGIEGDDKTYAVYWENSFEFDEVGKLTLSFEYKTSDLASRENTQIYQQVNNEWQSQPVGTKAKTGNEWKSATETLDSKATGVRFEFKGTGWGSEDVRNVVVTRKNYLASAVESINNENKFDIFYGNIHNVQYELTNISSTNPSAEYEISLSTDDEINNGKGDYGKYSFAIEASADVPTTLTAIAHFFTSEDEHLYIPVSLDFSASLSLVARNNDGYWATFSSDYAVEFSEDVNVYTVTVIGNQMTSNLVSNQVPANTGVLINATSNEVSYTYIASADGLGDNNLYPASKNKDELTGYKFYKLAYASENLDNLGFYWGADNGGAFVSREGSAYLAVPSTAAPARFVFGQPGVATAVENANLSTADGKKVMMNGVLYIIRDGKTYDSFGRMVK